MRLTYGALLVPFALVVNSRTAAATIDWPDGYVVCENTASPNGHHGVLLPTMEAWEQDESLSQANYLADLKIHRVLGKLDSVDYFEHQNHRSLAAYWAPDSSICVVENDARYGAESISVLQIKDSSFSQTEIGDRIQKSLDNAMKKQAHTEMSGDVSPYFRFGTDRKVRVRALSQNNPKQFEDVEHTTFENEEIKAESLDQTLNKVYRAAQFILPLARFAAVKKEQIEWLKKRDAAPLIVEKCKLIEARIKALQELLW